MIVGDAGFCNYPYQGQTYDRDTGLDVNFRVFESVQAAIDSSMTKSYTIKSY